MARKKFTTSLDENLLKDLKKRAIDEERQINEILEELLQEYLKSSDSR